MLVLALLAGLGSGSRAASRAAADDLREWPRTCPASNRFGVAVGAVGGGSGTVMDYDVAQLNAGWYQDFVAQIYPPRPAGLGYVQTIRLSDDGPFDDRACSVCPAWDRLRTAVVANPRSLWLIGTEPDSPAQDNILPEHYPRLYHDLYWFLKSVDPACQVAIGAVIQGTPVRLQYLGMILDAYQSQYGTRIPMDVWNTHAYVCREKRQSPGCGDCWGCNIPPGISADIGMDYHGEDMDNMEYWTANVIAMRQFMHDRGYGDLPLIITEYGILFPEELGFPMDRVQTFMLATFDWMMTATDPELGDPNDGGRLVQAWAWMSLDWKYTPHPYTLRTYLFDPDTGEISALGSAYASYTANLTQPAVDLEPLAIRNSEPAPDGTGGQTTTVTVDVTNHGSVTASNVVVSFEKDGTPAGEVTIPSVGAGEVQPASVVWSGLAPGQVLQVTATVGTAVQTPECDLDNNTQGATIVVALDRIYLPFLTWRR
jgi:hypothetical protein